jgi:hypothetical protein
LSVNSNDDISISGEKLMFDELPDLEEDAVSSPQDLTSRA